MQVGYGYGYGYERKINRHETTGKDMSNETLIETAVDENGEVLWEEPYKFSRLSAPGEFMTWNGVSCRVISSVKTGAQIKTIVHVFRRPSAQEKHNDCMHNADAGHDGPLRQDG